MWHNWVITLSLYYIRATDKDCRLWFVILNNSGAHCHASAHFLKEGAKAPFLFAKGWGFGKQRGHIFVNRVLVNTNTNTNCDHDSFSKKENRIYIATLDYLTIYGGGLIATRLLLLLFFLDFRLGEMTRIARKNSPFSPFCQRFSP